MANTFVDYTGADGTGTDNKDFAFSFPYLDDSHIVVQVDQASVAGGAFVTKALTTDYTIVTSPSKLIRFVSAPASADRIRIKRDSASNTALVDFENGSVLTEVELDRAYLHNLYLNEEIAEGSGKNVMTKNSAGNFEADLAKIVDVADPTLAQDAATKNYVDTEITTERTARVADVDAEETARIAADALKVAKAGDSMTGELAMGSNKITGLATPTATTDASNKSYVDGEVATALATGVAGGLINTGNIADDAVTADKLAHTAVTPGAYTNTNITVDQQGRITAAATGTASELLTSIKTVDGTGSGLDADLLDGQEATAFAAASHTHTLSNISDAGTAAANNTGDFATAAQGLLADSAVQNGDNNITLTSTTGNVNMELGGATGFVSFIDLKNPSTDDYDVRVISDDNTTLDTVHTSRARIEGHNSLGLCAGDTSVGPIPEVVTVESNGIKVKGIALYNATSSTEGGQLLLNEPGVNSPVLSEAQSFSVDTFKDTTNISGHGTNSKMLRIFQGSVSTSPTAFADNGNVSFSGSLFPTVTASEDLGTASLKWQDVYSSTGAFNGSDLNLKQDIEELSEAEKRVAVTAKGLLKKYRLKKAVEEKGSNARYHFGIIAQELQAAFQAEGLDPMRYGIIAENTWWEKTVDGKRSVSNEEQEGYSEITEMAVRYTELLAFIISAL